MSNPTVTIDLTYPVSISGVPVKQLQLRRPKVKDILASEKMNKGSDADQERQLFANLLEQPMEVVLDLDFADYQKVQKAYTSFFVSMQSSAENL